MDRAGDVPLVPLVLLADVEEQRRVVGLEQARAPVGVDLLDLGLDLVQQLAVGGHWFRKDSESEQDSWRGTRGYARTARR